MMKLTSSHARYLLILMVVCAVMGCSDDNGTGPSKIEGVAKAVGTFEIGEGGNQWRGEWQITFDSIVEFRQTVMEGTVNRMVVTGPAAVSHKGQNEFLRSAAAALDSSPLRLNYRRQPDGTCYVAASMSAYADADNRYSMTWTAQYEDTVWLGQSSSLDDVAAATGVMHVTGIEGEVYTLATCNEVLISIEGMRPLIEGFVE